MCTTTTWHCEARVTETAARARDSAWESERARQRDKTEDRRRRTRISMRAATVRNEGEKIRAAIEQRDKGPATRTQTCKQTECTHRGVRKDHGGLEERRAEIRIVLSTALHARVRLPGPHARGGAPSRGGGVGAEYARRGRSGAQLQEGHAVVRVRAVHESATVGRMCAVRHLRAIRIVPGEEDMERTRRAARGARTSRRACAAPTRWRSGSPCAARSLPAGCTCSASSTERSACTPCVNRSWRTHTC